MTNTTPDAQANESTMEPLFRSSTMRVEDDWIDYNGHLNMAYYNVLFDRGVDEASLLLGLGADYLKRCNASYFTAEVHVSYLRELQAGDPVYSTFQLIDFDAKRMHFFQELRHADKDWVSATSEQLSLHVDMTTKKVTPWPDDISNALQAMLSAHSTLPTPARVGRKIGIIRKPTTS